MVLPLLEPVIRSRSSSRTEKTCLKNYVGLLRRISPRRFILFLNIRDESALANIFLHIFRQVLNCITDLFSGAKGIQIWLNLCARLISKSIPEDRLPEAMSGPSRKQLRSTKTTSSNRLKKEQMTSVVWTTPMGLPIVQPYRKTKRKQISTALQTVFISDPNSPAEGESVF